MLVLVRLLRCARPRRPAPPAGPVTQLPVDPELQLQLARAAAAAVCSCEGWSQLVAAGYDPERGSLRLYLAGRVGALTVAVTDAHAAGNIAAMPQLSRTQVRMYADGPHVEVLAVSVDGVYAVRGTAAWTA